MSQKTGLSQNGYLGNQETYVLEFSGTYVKRTWSKIKGDELKNNNIWKKIDKWKLLTYKIWYI